MIINSKNYETTLALIISMFCDSSNNTGMFKNFRKSIKISAYIYDTDFFLSKY